MKPSNISKALAVAIKKGHPLMLSGKPGVGKTELVMQAAKLAEAKLIISHPVVSDPTDYKGMPWVMMDENGKHVARFLPFSDLDRLVTAKGRTIFLLDDLGQAPPTVQAAAMQLILGRRINEIVISNDVVFLACTNRKEDKAGVQGILEPVKSRFFAIIDVETDVEDWAEWAIREELPFSVINFVRWKPAMLLSFDPTFKMTNSPSPRTVYHACKIMQAGYPKEVENEMLQGACGEAWVIEWMAFRTFEAQLPNINKILTDPDKGEIPPEAHMMYALCGALAERANEQTFANIVAYSNRVASTQTIKGSKLSGRPDFSIMLIKDCLLKDAKLRKNKAYLAWQILHSDIII